MPPLTDNNIRDLATGTLKELGRGKFQQIAQRLREYPVMSSLIKKDRVVVDDGIGVQRNVMTEHGNTAKQTGLWGQDNTNQTDYMRQITVPWRQTTVNMSWERRELLRNRGASAIFDLFESRYTSMIYDLADHMERQFWYKPDTGTDELDIWGLPRWVVKGTAGQEGFVGGDPYTGYGAGDLLVATAPKWKNYFADYAEASRYDLFRRMKKAARKIKFKAIRNLHKDYKRGADDLRIFTNDAVADEMDEELLNRNDNLGNDLGTRFGSSKFMQKDVEPIDELNNDTSDPVYMLNFAYMNPIFLKGDYMRESEPDMLPYQHNVWAVFLDLTWNVMCVDRRRMAVFAKI